MEGNWVYNKLHGEYFDQFSVFKNKNQRQLPNSSNRTFNKS